MTRNLAFHRHSEVHKRASLVVDASDTSVYTKGIPEHLNCLVVLVLNSMDEAHVCQNMCIVGVLLAQRAPRDLEGLLVHLERLVELSLLNEDASDIVE